MKKHAQRDGVPSDYKRHTMTLNFSIAVICTDEIYMTPKLVKKLCAIKHQ